MSQDEVNYNSIKPEVYQLLFRDTALTRQHAITLISRSDDWSWNGLFIFYLFIFVLSIYFFVTLFHLQCKNVASWNAGNLPAPAAHYSEWPRQPTLSRSMHYPHKWISLNITNSFVIPLCNLRFCQMVSLLCVCVCVCVSCWQFFLQYFAGMCRLSWWFDLSSSADCRH